jgi:hypothetical protein
VPTPNASIEVAERSLSKVGEKRLHPATRPMQKAWACQWNGKLPKHRCAEATQDREMAHPAAVRRLGLRRIILLVLAAIVGFSGYALAQTAAKSGKPLKQVKPSAPMGCKLVGIVKGTKIWAGDCASGPELRGTPPTVEPAAPAPTPEANPPAGNAQ